LQIRHQLAALYMAMLACVTSMPRMHFPLKGCTSLSFAVV
jgi:hypothetical protein